MVDVEEYFPRGGKKPAVARFKQSDNFLGAIERGEKKKKKPNKKNDGYDDGYLSDEDTKEIDQSCKNCTAGIGYKTIKPGVLILGRVRQVMETKVNVMLPTKMIGSVMACHISEPYNKLLQAYVNDQTEKVPELPKMFRRGQYVALKVLEATKGNLMLSMMPQHISSGRVHTELQKGVILQAAVSSVEDHGYVMDIGVPNVRAFLPKSKANPEVELETGLITWCLVKSVSTSSDSSIVTLSSKLSALQHAVQRRSTPVLLPATGVEFTVDKPLANGIEGHIFNDVTSYVQRYHTDFGKGKKPTLGEKIQAWVLYVMPTRNTPFLTTRNIFKTTYPNLEEEQKLKEGDIVDEALVIKITGRSVHFKLGPGSIGTMSLKRVFVDEDLTDEEVIAKSYPIGSSHRVRVLCYNLCDYQYSVTDEPNVLDEKYFSVSQLAVGDFVPGTIKSVDGKHVLVTIGRVTGCVPRSHLSDAGVFVDPKKPTTSKLPKKFKVGQDVQARVLSVDIQRETVFLTLKPSLLDPEFEILRSYTDAQIGKAYTGTIKYIRDYILVGFFNNVMAYVPRNYVTKEPVENLTDIFHVGEIVKCTILRVDTETKRMSGSLVTAPFWPAKKREKPDLKRKERLQNTDEVPNKKRKTNEKMDSVSEDKKAKTKDGKHMKSLKNAGSKNKEISEESDAIETDIDEDSDQRVEPQDLGLKDLSDEDADVETLKSYTDAKIGKAYTGTVKFIKDYVLVGFSKNVRAYVQRNYVTKEPVKNLTDILYVGQTIKCTILRVDPEKKTMSGSLVTTPFWPAPKRERIDKCKQELENFNDAVNKKQISDKKGKPKKDDREVKTDENDIVKKRSKKNKNYVESEVFDGNDLTLSTHDMDIGDSEEQELKKQKLKNKKDNGQNSKKSKSENSVGDTDHDIGKDQLWKKKDKRKNKKVDSQNVTKEIIEKSDAIETDFQEDSDQVLTPQDLGLIDLSDCVTAKNYKKRVVSLIKAIKARTKRLDKIDKKIINIEEIGLNPKNKKFHTAMHIEKIMVEERIKNLIEALNTAQQKLKELDLGDSKDYKKKKALQEPVAGDDEKKSKTEDAGEEKRNKIKNIKIVENLEPALEVPSIKDFWSANTESSTVNAQEESSSSEEEEESQPKKKRKKLTIAEKVAKVREEEERVRDMERRAIESESQPRSVEQFERALLASPDSSQLWIAYMAFHLQATEIEKARAVGRKAVKTISFREEDEKLNVWLALINCEYRFGTKESQQKTLEEALQMNEPFKIHSKLLDIFVEISNQQELTSLVDLMIRKYKRDPKTYIQCGNACFKLGLVEKARQVMQKGVSVLEKKEHVAVLVQFALMERVMGERERAEALFGQILAVYPQRVDVCSTYVDMLVKGGDVEHVRQVMERITSQKLPARKMKILYRKWIEVEEKLGDSEHAESIRQRAMEFIDKAKF